MPPRRSSRTEGCSNEQQIVSVCESYKFRVTNSGLCCSESCAPDPGSESSRASLDLAALDEHGKEERHAGQSRRTHGRRRRRNRRGRRRGRRWGRPRHNGQQSLGRLTEVGVVLDATLLHEVWRTSEARGASERVRAREERAHVGRSQYPPALTVSFASSSSFSIAAKNSACFSSFFSLYSWRCSTMSLSVALVVSGERCVQRE